jgi:hypothetical protein
MNSDDISRLIEKEFSSYSYELPEPGLTYGKPWSEEKVLSYIPKLRKALVKPYLQRFRLIECKEHWEKETFAELWVVAIDHGYIQWFDPQTGEYGLGQETDKGEFVSIGVRGDLVGVYCAM